MKKITHDIYMTSIQGKLIKLQSSYKIHYLLLV